MAGDPPPAVTRVDPARAASVVERWREQHPGGAIVRLRADRALDRTSLFAEVERALSLPPWFGRNWDALWDCLTDLSWLDRPAYLLVVTDAEQLLRDSPQELPLLLELLRAATAAWASGPVPTAFATLLVTAAGEASA
ncbi:barstar family protein [uncultured Friedmanniella sp.]|uniref:barstar family protein n=1 Tax=uncultured Friedmanniella sp. TaxID=335381 RepID=UPI0035CB44C9